jgi:hypothetical protein
MKDGQLRAVKVESKKYYIWKKEEWGWVLNQLIAKGTFGY